MPDLPKKKVGIVACSGEELPQGTVTRLAALKVLEQLRPEDTVTICLPLFLAGGEGDRAFARFYPTIALDGCAKRCAALGTERYSGKPAASLVVDDLIAELGLGQPEGRRRLNAAGLQAVDAVAGRVAEVVDGLLEKRWNRRAGAFDVPEPAAAEAPAAACSCGSGLPVQKILIAGQTATLSALPLIFQQFHDAGKAPTEVVARELFDTVKVYNTLPAGEEAAYTTALLREYAAFCQKEAARA
jgi:uncharacterized metal-binding protein